MIGGRWWCFSEGHIETGIRSGRGRGRRGDLDFW